MLALLCCSLPPLLAAAGAEFPAGEAALPAAEGAGPAGRRARVEGGHTQDFLSLLGPEGAPERARTARQFGGAAGQRSRFSLNVGFGNSGGSTQLFDPQSAFQNFPAFSPTVQPPAVAVSRGRQGTRAPPAPAPAFSIPARAPSRLPPNADPRSRQRGAGPAEGGRARRVRPRVQDTRPRVQDTAPRVQDIQPAGPTDFQPAFVGRSQAPPPRAVVVTESPLLLKCLEETDRHTQEIEELENRTALHIDYAQEKQIEIKVLENFLEETRNQSHLNEKKREVLEAAVQNMTNIIKRKDDKIRGLKDEKKKVEATLKSEIKMKQQNIEGLNKRLENASTELSNMKATLNEQTNEVTIIYGRLEKVKATVKRLNVEKKNLLQIVQALAEIGNPALNFSKFIQNDEEDAGGEAVDEEEGSAEYEYEYSDASGEEETSEEGSATASTPNSSEI